MSARQCEEDGWAAERERLALGDISIGALGDLSLGDAGSDGAAGADDEPDFGEEEFEEEEEEAEPVVAVKAKPALAPAKLRRHKKLRALLLSKYDAVWSQAQALGWTPLDEREVEAVEEDGGKKSNDWNITWSDNSVGFERIMRMNRLQKVNHFPGMLELVRKAGTARNLNKMLKAVGKAYNIFPKTFMLPADYTELKKEWEHGKNHGNKTFIVKPSKGCQGTGIRLTRCLDDISPHEPNIVQRYMHRPHLIDGYKYDLRLYVLLSSIAPMRIYLFREGLVRMCTTKYQPLEKNMHDTRMHLTNYAINKVRAEAC